MTLFTRTLLLFACLAVALAALGIPTMFSKIVDGTASFQSLVDSFLNFRLLSVVAAAIVASSIFVGGGVAPILIFVPIIAVFTTLFTFPQEIFSSGGLPSELNVIVQGIYSLLQIVFIVACVGWLKGNE